MNRVLLSGLVVGALGAMALPASAATFNGNGATGFGGPLGNGNLVVTDDGTTLNFTFNSGAANNDFLVIYFDTVSGGLANTVGVNDVADSNRNAISGHADGSNVVFASGFGADYAISLNGGGFAGLWTMATGGNNSLTYIQSANIGGTQSVPTFNVPLSALGLTAGDSFDFVATYAASSGWLSNETIGTSVTTPGTDGFAGVNAADDGVVTFSNSLQYTTVPEPASLGLLSLGALGLLRRRK